LERNRNTGLLLGRISRSELTAPATCQIIDQYRVQNRNVQRNATNMDSYIVAYDIANDKRLRKVAKIAEDFGIRKQYSVFCCRLGPTDMVRMRARLYDVMKLDEDQVLFIPVCGKCVEQIDTLGRPTEAPTARDVVIVT
jgi:CRISPR-associated protein Cas2